MTVIHHDIIIVGAGIAGLAAAVSLHESGFDTLVLEARNRIGGRINTLYPSTLKYPLELGAEFVHGRSEILWQLVNQTNIRLNDTCPNHWTAKAGQLKYEAEYFKQLEAFFLELERRVLELDENQDESLAEFVEHITRTKPELSEAAETSCQFIRDYLAAEPEIIGIRFIALGEAAAQNIGTEALQVLDGYDNLLHTLVDQQPQLKKKIKLNTVVKQINWQTNQVCLSATCQENKSIEFSARQVLITVPLGVLQKANHEPGAITFLPPLVEKNIAISKLKMGMVSRLIVTFKERFWEALTSHDDSFPEFGFISCPEAPINHWWSQYPVRSAVLVGWLSGEDQTKADEAEWKQLAAQSISIIFNEPVEKIFNLIEEIYYHNWGEDPYACGAYSFRPQGCEADAKILALPVENTLFFAGEATETNGYSGTIHGALATGLRAAEEIRKCQQTRQIQK